MRSGNSSVATESDLREAVMQRRASVSYLDNYATEVRTLNKKQGFVASMQLDAEQLAQAAKNISPLTEKVFIAIKAQLNDERHPLNILNARYSHIFVSNYKQFVNKKKNTNRGLFLKLQQYNNQILTNHEDQDELLEM